MNNNNHLNSLSDQDKAYRESLSVRDRALYDYYNNNQAATGNKQGGFTLEKLLGSELTVANCTPEFWAKIGIPDL
jgi:hypothetical protein